MYALSVLVKKESLPEVNGSEKGYDVIPTACGCSSALAVRMALDAQTLAAPTAQQPCLA